jgi:hypothetical protein
LGEAIDHLSWRVGTPAPPVAAACGAPATEIKMSEINLERALNDPADLFENPDAVFHHPALTREQKVQFLKNGNWMRLVSRGPRGRA